jgi:predicted NodU family carbamoyl transferase
MKPVSSLPTNMLGISAYYHDSAACLLRAFVYALF